jgi:hypothetical protein
VVTNHVLASVILFDIALIVPLLTLRAAPEIKITLGVISGSWIQWWALPALQRSQNKTQAQNEAKAEMDHETLTYLSKLQDEQMIELKGITEILRNLQRRICDGHPEAYLTVGISIENLLLDQIDSPGTGVCESQSISCQMCWPFVVNLKRG